MDRSFAMYMYRPAVLYSGLLKGRMLVGLELGTVWFDQRLAETITRTSSPI